MAPCTPTPAWLTVFVFCAQAGAKALKLVSDKFTLQGLTTFTKMIVSNDSVAKEVSTQAACCYHSTPRGLSNCQSVASSLGWYETLCAELCTAQAVEIDGCHTSYADSDQTPSLQDLPPLVLVYISNLVTVRAAINNSCGLFSVCSG